MKQGLFSNFSIQSLPPNTEVIYSKGQVVFNYDVRLSVIDAGGAGIEVKTNKFRIKAIYGFPQLAVTGG